VHFWNTVKRQPYHSADFPDVNQVKGVDQFVHDSLFNLLGTSVEPDELVEEGELNRFTNDYLIGPQYPRQFSSGFHQLLPIIVQSALMDPGETLSIENPEVHLHPDLQLKVSEFLLQQSRTGRQILIETHSDLMIRRIVRAMLAEEDGLSQQHVSLNFSSPRKGDHGTGSVLHQFGVDSSGRIEWPDGFMDASINESQRMMDVMYGRRSSPHTEGNE